MTKEFEIALEELYQTFSKYPFKSTIDGCPCCVSNLDKSTLHSKSLRELEDEDISRYAFKAMTTWGDTNDFKHYLPRIFELSSTRKLIVDTFVVLGKLDYGNWLEWDEVEIKSINTFLISWWKYDINNNNYLDAELLVELNKLGVKLHVLLEDWNLDVNAQGFKNYVEFIELYYFDLTSKNKTFKSFSEEDLTALKSWIKSNIEKLEEGFFVFEKNDKEFSERISNALYVYERIK